MEGIGSYISVVGLSSLFSGDFVIILMAIILDIAKITSISFLYQYWEDIKIAAKSYMTTAVIVLMLITSAGAFGYLSSAFQRAVQPNKEVALRVEAYTNQLASLESEKKELSDQKLSINKQIAAIPTENESSRRRLIAAMKPELDRAGKRLQEVNTQIDSLREKSLAAKSETLDKDVHAGPIIYVSKAFGVSLEDASKYIILVIVSVFDPLAVMLILAANLLIKKRKYKPVEEAIVETTLPLPEPPVEEPKPEVQPLVLPSGFFNPPKDQLIKPVKAKRSPIKRIKAAKEPELLQEPVQAPIPIVDVVPPQGKFIDKPIPVVLEKQGMVLK